MKRKGRRSHLSLSGHDSVNGGHNSGRRSHHSGVAGGHEGVGDAGSVLRSDGVHDDSEKGKR